MNAPTVDPAPADQLLVRINEAVAAVNKAEKTAETVKTVIVSRSKVVGKLLLEAKKLHPAVKDFEAFLKRVDGLGRSRAYDLLRLAGGRTTDEELRKDARDRQEKSRKKKKGPKPAPALKEPEPKPVSVTDPDVTETAEARAGEREVDRSAGEATMSARALAEFTFACREYLPRMTAADQHKALQLVTDLVKPKAEAA